MSRALSGRTAIVTGASRGIGLACAKSLASRGANVVLTSRDKEAVEAAAAKVGCGALGVVAPVLDDVAAERCIETAIDHFGGLDILVNNVGTNPAFGPVVSQDRGRFMKTLEVNVWGPALWTSLAWRHRMESDGGVIVNMASLGGLMVGPQLGVYQAAKAALIHLTKQWALELGPRVRVNAVAPGVVRTRLAEAVWVDKEEVLAENTPLKRIGEPGDVGEVVAFLASDASSWMTGETLLVDGGQILTRANA